MHPCLQNTSVHGLPSQGGTDFAFQGFWEAQQDYFSAVGWGVGVGVGCLDGFPSTLGGRERLHLGKKGL